MFLYPVVEETATLQLRVIIMFILPVIMAGGTGSRLWPLSRDLMPKQFLKLNGDLSYIIPNKWMSAGYGKNLRKYLLSKTNPSTIIDFEKVFVFDEAVVFVCILGFSKSIFSNNIRAVTIIDKDEMQDFETVFKNRSIKIENHSERGWQIVSDTINSINIKIENKGVLLKDWKGLGFYRGITTGFNDAYIIDEKVKHQILLEEPSSNSVIKKVLRGRNIKRFKYEYDNINLLFIPHARCGL